MKTKLVFTCRKMYAMLMVAVCVLFLESCAEGYDSPVGFDVGVNNTQVVTPDSISFTVNSAGTEATISWPLVLGAKGYEVSFLNVDNPDSAKVVDSYDKYMVDGCKMTATVAEDSKYRLEIRALGDPERGNTDDTTKTYALSTLVKSVATIPDGSDIYQYMQEHPLDSAKDEVAIDLEPGGTYTLTGPINFNGHKLTFRGDKLRRATVNMVDKGCLMTYAGLKIKYINFDFAQSTSSSLLFMSPDSVTSPGNYLPESIKSQNLGYTRQGSLIKDIYVVQDPIYIANCWFKDMPAAMIHDNNMQCAYWYFTITNCIVQMKNSGSEGLISLQKKGRMIKNITIDKSTIFNTVPNASAYFIRYSNSSNSNPQKTFGDATSDLASQSITFTNSTFSKSYTGQKFVNNINGTGLTINVDHCIFYDVCQTRRLALGTRVFKFNFWYGVTSPDSGDPILKDTSGAPFASVYDPQFAGDVTMSLDFTKPNGGVNFTPQEYQIFSNGAGDPRWLTK